MRKKIFMAVAVLLLFIFAFSGYKLFTYYVNSKREAEALDKLAEAVQNSTAPQLRPGEILPQYAGLYEQNPDLFGWIAISDTKIDYPVMYTPGEPEFYLRRAFDKTYSISGVPFLSADCFENGGNYLIYGHNMKNGTMFAAITKYKDRAFWESHKTISFNTLYEEAEYEVIAAFRTKIIPEDNPGFKYWEYTDLTDKVKFGEYIEQVKLEAIYDTAVTAEYGDGLLTLSTCAYHEKDGRFVVVAKKIKK